jgi:hypothetical protein
MVLFGSGWNPRPCFATGPGAGLNTAGLKLITAELNTEYARGRINGAEYTLAGNNPARQNTPGMTTRPIQGGWRIGHTNQGGESWVGTISEVLVYNTKLSPGEVASVEAYLGAKWGLDLA